MTHLDLNGRPFHPLEAFILNTVPFVLATQERFSIFKEEIQKRLFERCSCASIPSGLMADLLDLDYSSLKNFSLYGIDLDPKTLIQAKNYSFEKGLFEHCVFIENNAWNLNIKEAFDLISCNGLTYMSPMIKKLFLSMKNFIKLLNLQEC